MAMVLASDWVFPNKSDTRRSAVFPLASPEAMVDWGHLVAWDMEVVLAWVLVIMEALEDMVEQSLVFQSSLVATCTGAWVAWDHLEASVPLVVTVLVC